MASDDVSRASNDSEATVAFSSASPSPSASPLKTPHAVERAETPLDVVHHFRAAKPTAVVQWAATAHGILSQVQWARVAASVIECPVCKVRHDGPRHLAKHSNDCLLRMLMQYPAIFPSPRTERSPDLVRPTPLRADTVVVAEPLELNCLSVSAFHASESHLLKSLSRVSVSDHEPDFGSLSSSQLEHLCPPPLADSAHMLSQFTDAPLTSFVEESILAVGLKAVAKRHAAFDRTWSLVGFYHVVGTDSLQFEAVSDRDQDAIWDAHPELEAAIRRVRHRRSARDPKVFPCVGDPDMPTLDDIKSRLLQQYSTQQTV
ncbi:hypothetical protein SPRG_03030 [Saprolegnia parasitica CBS 223.65]|uniref:Uncharacterized protein n=1 Tax=Saprolegnia parasitica (strain CBS 223.65) TaxID=695850 RepID=A0A067CTI1_SAPPC|nr:hypothetical protein SPRG_03030 [Saprolegnia parasitica CBS 223.65]KDO32555.1 hypothetical protein SPRG_03030 [Saprolegnia parasitica CBS 223.65]|eukprot:XP_012197001.1 hypothetical protein SPRG_03030 [Saprolegnia parasitica CBS 223.65]